MAEPVLGVRRGGGVADGEEGRSEAIRSSPESATEAIRATEPLSHQTTILSTTSISATATDSTVTDRVSAAFGRDRTGFIGRSLSRGLRGRLQGQAASRCGRGPT